MADVVRRPGVGAIVGGPTATGAPKIRRDPLLDSRVRVLLVIAERFAELTDPLGGPAGVRGDGGSGPSMPGTYTASVREFERLVVRLREERHSKWWHVNEFWLRAESRTVYHCPRCGPVPGSGETHRPEHEHVSRKNGSPLTVKCKRVVLVRRHRNADEVKARVGLEWIAREWGLAGEPMLPDEIRAVAA